MLGLAFSCLINISPFLHLNQTLTIPVYREPQVTENHNLDLNEEDRVQTYKNKQTNKQSQKKLGSPQCEDNSK